MEASLENVIAATGIEDLDNIRSDYIRQVASGLLIINASVRYTVETVDVISDLLKLPDTKMPHKLPFKTVSDRRIINLVAEVVHRSQRTIASPRDNGRYNLGALAGAVDFELAAIKLNQVVKLEPRAGLMQEVIITLPESMIFFNSDHADTIANFGVLTTSFGRVLA